MDKREQLKLVLLTLSMAAGVAYSYGFFDRLLCSEPRHETRLSSRNTKAEDTRSYGKTYIHKPVENSKKKFKNVYAEDERSNYGSGS